MIMTWVEASCIFLSIKSFLFFYIINKYNLLKKYKSLYMKNVSYYLRIKKIKSEKNGKYRKDFGSV